MPEEPAGSIQASLEEQLAAIVAAQPAVICDPDYYDNLAPIAVAFRRQGFTGPLLGGDSWDSPRLFHMAGNAVERGFFTEHFRSP